MIGAAALMTILELPGFVKSRCWLGLAVYCAAILAGLALALLIQLQVELPSLAGLLLAVVERFLPFVPVFFEA